MYMYMGLQLTLHCMPLQAIKTGSEGRFRNKAARVETLALFLDKVRLFSRSDCNLSRAQPNLIATSLATSTSQSHRTSNHKAQCKS